MLREECTAIWECPHDGVCQQDIIGQGRNFDAQAAAFGDGENDIDMLRAVNYGVAMANAPEAVRQQAKFVTLSNDEQGILYVMKQWI